MRRLLRILLNTATVLSLVLCAATVGAWVRSYLARDVVWWRSNGWTHLAIGTYRGGLVAGVVTPVAGTVNWVHPGVGCKRSEPASYAEMVRPEETFFNEFGVALVYFESGGLALRQLACPYWFILLLMAILPVVQLIMWRRRARRLRMRPGLCQDCGYDCRATPERCPECGSALVTARVPAREGKGETEGV